MKKLLALILLSPLAYSEVVEYYCQKDTNTYLSLKIDDDLNNPSFVIENHIDRTSVGSDNFVADTNNIKVMPLTILVAGNDDLSGFLFNRATFELKDIWFADDRRGRERNKTYKEFIKDSTALKTDESIGYYATDYICQLYLSNKP